MKLIKYIFLFFIFFTFLNSQEITLKKGQTRVFNTTKDITTVFTSDPKVINYNVIGTKKIIVYATDIGQASIKIFGDKDSKLLMSADFTVDDVSANLYKLAKIIQLKNKGAKNIKIEMLSLPGQKDAKSSDQAYVISGQVPNEETRDNVYNMAVAALGLKVNDSDKEAKQAPSSDSAIGASTDSSDDSAADESISSQNTSDNLIDKLELPKKNLVNIEVVVAEVDKTFLETLGLDIGGGIYKFNLLDHVKDDYWRAVNVPPVRYDPKNPFAVPPKPTGKPLDIFQTGLKAVSPIKAFLEAIKEDKRGKILAKPNLSVLSGNTATFSVKGRFGYLKPVVDNGNVSYESTDLPLSEISMLVKPKVNSDDDITLYIEQKVNNATNIAFNNGVPVVSGKDRSVASTIELGNGDSFIISGLTDEKESESVRSTPLLGDIPVIGAAFRRSSIVKQKTELVIIATVKLVSPIGPGESYEIPTFKTRNLLESFFNLENSKSKDFKKQGNDFISNIQFIY